MTTHHGQTPVVKPLGDRDYWDQQARRYDASMRFLGTAYPRMLARVGKAVQGCDRVLEVAAGTGLVTATLGRVAKEVVATDYAERMVQILCERVRALGLDNVSCEQADLYRLRFDPGTFDAVVAANVLHIVPDLANALIALRRVLKPGGMLVVPTFCHDETRLSRLVSRLLAITGFPGSRRFTVRSLCDTLEQAGFTIVRTEILPGVIPIGYVHCVANVSNPSSS